MNRKQQLLCSLLSSSLVLGMPAAALADESANDEFQMDEYVITANRIPVKLTETAANVTVITHEDIKKGNFSNVPDILRNNNINIEEDGTGALAVINGDPRVLILVDGRRMNWDQIVKSGSKGGMNLSHLSVQNIERIEIVHGPASSLYGSDAVGGVINIITHKATKENTTLLTEGGSWGMQRYGITTENKLDNGFSYFIAAEKKKQDDFTYKDAETGQNKRFDQSHYDENSLTMRLDKDLANGRSLSLQFDHDDRSGGFSFTVPGRSYSDVYYYPDGHEKSNEDNLAVTYKWGENNLLRVYHNDSRDDVAYDATSGYSITRKATGMNWQQSLHLDNHHTLVTGADWRQDDFSYPSQGIDKSYSNKALFVEDRWRLPSNWSLTFGTRYDDHSIIGGHTTSRITANRQMNGKTNVFASWGQFIKAPLVEDMFSNTKYMIGNPDLQPESGDTLTIGINTELAANTKLQASIFTSRLKNAIDYSTADDGRTLAVNIDRQKRRGADISLSRQLSPQWSASAGYSYVQIENKDYGEADYSNDLNNNQPNFYHLGIKYSQDKWNSELTLRTASGRSIERFTSSDYTVLDMVVNYQLSPETRIYAKGYNLTNRAYEVRSCGDSSWIYAGAYPMPGRSFYVGIEQKI